MLNIKISRHRALQAQSKAPITTNILISCKNSWIEELYLVRDPRVFLLCSVTLDACFDLDSVTKLFNCCCPTHRFKDLQTWHCMVWYYSVASSVVGTVWDTMINFSFVVHQVRNNYVTFEQLLWAMVNYHLLCQDPKCHNRKVSADQSTERFNGRLMSAITITPPSRHPLDHRAGTLDQPSEPSL